MNNQHPSEVMGGSRIRGSRRVCVCVCEGRGVLVGRRWHGSSWNLAFCEAPWLMEGSKVNSNVLKLYLIFIHMDVEGWDRLLQTNWNAWDQGWGGGRGGGNLYVSMNVWECIRKQIHPFSILIFSFPVHTQKHIYYHYLVSRIKSQLIPPDAFKEMRSFWLTQEIVFKQAFSPHLYKYLLPIRKPVWNSCSSLFHLPLNVPWIKRLHPFL